MTHLSIYIPGVPQKCIHMTYIHLLLPLYIEYYNFDSFFNGIHFLAPPYIALSLKAGIVGSFHVLCGI